MNSSGRVHSCPSAHGGSRRAGGPRCALCEALPLAEHSRKARCARLRITVLLPQRALAAREGLMDLEKDILLPLMREAVRRGGAPSLQAVQAMPRLDLGMLLLQTFIRYPKPALSRAWIPFNYCALPRLYPGFDMLARAVNWLCPLAAA